MKKNRYIGAVITLSVMLAVAVLAIVLRAVRSGNVGSGAGSESIDFSEESVSSSESESERVDIRESVEVPIIMYHHVLKNENRWSNYVISPDEFEEDLKYLQANGYETITMTELIEYVENGKELPEKPIILTFDDGQLSFCEYICPLLEEYGEKAVLSVIGSCVDLYEENGDRTVDYACINWDDAVRITESGYAEIQNHSYDMHKEEGRKGASKNWGESLENYRKAIFEDVGGLQEKILEKTGVKPNTFTYPYGAISVESDGIMKELGFKATLSCASGINVVEYGDFDDLYSLKRLTRFHKVTLESLLEEWGR